MKLTKKFGPAMMLIFLILLAACGGGETAVSTSSDPVNSPTPPATFTPPPRATATPDALATAGVVQYVATINAQRSPDVPPLPFDDNPDPLQCGIPVTWTNDAPAWLNGVYEGELVRPTVFLYDGHLRLNIQAQAAHGSEVEVLLYQQNPVTDYYLVKVIGAEQPNEGWVPAPFLSFEPIAN